MDIGPIPKNLKQGKTKTTQALEQRLETFAPASQTIDMYTTGTTALYTMDPPKPIDFTSNVGDSATQNEEQYGLLTKERFQYGYSLGNEYKVDFHGPNETVLTHAHLKDALGEIKKEFNGYESALLDLALNTNFKKFP